MLGVLTLTETLGLFLGVYMLAAAIGLLIAPKQILGILAEFKTSTGLSFITAIMAFSIGAVIVAVHNVWVGPLAIAVSIIGWAALIEGALFLAFRGAFLRAVDFIPMTSGLVRAYVAIVFVAGGLLVFGALN